MNLSVFFNQLAQLLEVNVTEVSPEKSLYKFDLWDSLAIVSTIGLIDQCFGVPVIGVELFNCEKVQDLLTLIETKQKAKAIPA